MYNFDNQIKKRSNTVLKIFFDNQIQKEETQY